jgi:LPS sulfotransferase NodH
MAIHILLARQRSGTGALGSTLDQHAAIRYLGEVFHTDGYEREDNYFNFLLARLTSDPRRGLPDANDRNFTEFMEHLAATQAGKPNVIIDVKYSSTHHFNGGWYSPCDMPKFIQFAKRGGMKIIHLKRKNLIKTFVSGRLAEMNKVWHAREEEEVKTRQLNVEKQPLLNYLNTTQRIINHFDGYLRKYPHVIELEYEELFRPDGSIVADELAKVSGFLDIDNKPFETLQPSFVKQTSDELSEVITNYAEVIEFLAKTPFRNMLGAPQ